MSETILVGVGWPYPNGSLHLGQIAGAYLPADIFARYNRVAGNRVLMVSGSDQHGTPITVGRAGGEDAAAGGGPLPQRVRRLLAAPGDQDYRRHIRKYVLPTLGTLPLASLTARDILGLRSELRQRDLALKFVKNILAGSFKAMLRDARNIDGLMPQDPFAGVTWPRVELPGPDPFTADERHRILAWFRDKHFGIQGLERPACAGVPIRPSTPSGTSSSGQGCALARPRVCVGAMSISSAACYR